MTYSPMQKRYPFKFLDAYTRDDRAFFFGRNEEVAALYEMVFQTDLLLVYGASGTGKTSLIQCGLASRFESHDWLPIYVRRGNDLNQSLEKALTEAVGPVEAEAMDLDLDWLNEDLSDGAAIKPNLSSPLARKLRDIYLQHFKPIYLIFDQFEELYIIGNKEEQAQFVQTIKELLLVEQPVKVIFSIREEYLGELYEFEREVPELLRKKLRVEPMNLDKVKAVIRGIDQLEQSNVHLEDGQEERIAELIFKKIRGSDRSLGIQLPYLQVFLDKLYLTIAGDQKRQEDALFSVEAIQRMGDIGDVLRSFLDEQVIEINRSLRKGYPQATVANVWKLLSPFVTLEGTKEPISLHDLQARLPDFEQGVVQRIVEMLTASRILRYSESEGLYEIAHDELAKRIAEKRSDDEIALLEVRRLVESQASLSEEAREFFTEKQLGFIEPFLDQLPLGREEQDWIERSRAHVQAQREAEAERQKRELVATRRRLNMVRGLLALAVLTLLVAAYSGYRANQQRLTAEKERANALKQTERAERALTNFQRENAAREQLEFNGKESRANAILEAGGCPEDLFREMAEIADRHPDSTKLRDKIKTLQLKNPSCR